jgi:hypothetical protein
MNTEKILDLICKIENNITEIRKEMGIENNQEIKKDSETAREDNKKRSKAIDLTLPIKKLYDNNFFSDFKSDLDVVEKLKFDLLTNKVPKRASVVNVLRKMVKGGILIRSKMPRDKKTIIVYKNKI